MKLSRKPDDMLRKPEDCAHRGTASADECTTCRLLPVLTGIHDPEYCRVGHDVCLECCAELRPPQQVNPVIASLVYNVATRVIAERGHAECSVPHAEFLRECITSQLTLDLPDVGQQFPPAVVAISGSQSASRASQSDSVVWATAMLTAPRAAPRIEATIDSLLAAGFPQLHVFAEPNSILPKRRPELQVTVRQARLGNIRNFCTALMHLRQKHRDADVFAIFQDDITVAKGLRVWFESQLWPLGNGVVSLFTPRLHADRKPGWRLLSPGFQRVCGAQALVFRRDSLDQFLSDPQVLQCMISREHGDDAVLGGWLSQQGRKIAYHTPSLVEHVGDMSSVYTGPPDQRNFSQAIGDVGQLDAWQPNPPQPGTIGLCGWNTSTGLGTINRDLAAELQAEHWLIPQHPELPEIDSSNIHRVTQTQITRGLNSETDLRNWLAPLDWLLFAERPLLDDLPRTAAHCGVGIACIPMWEWIQPHHAWLQFVDVMLCPSQWTYDLMDDWKSRYGFGWDPVRFSWPINTDRFRFQQRFKCQRFLFINGRGGGMAHRLDGSECGYHRKGLELILAAADMAPDLPFLVYSQVPLPASLPSNIEVRQSPTELTALYNHGDVCVQPSHYEGLGLQLLECQAAGIPLITTDAPPMNEHNPWRTIPVRDQEVVQVGDGFISAEQMTPEDLVDALRAVMGCDLSAASQQARTHIEKHHNWASVRSLIQHELRKR